MIRFPLFLFKKRKLYFIVVAMIFFDISSAIAQLAINEVSQGSSGNMEYVEFLVVGTPSCAGGNCIDLRGWIIDDNNGWHATGLGMGIAPGCMRFSNDPAWECVSLGTLIVIYNDSEKNPSLPADNRTGAGCRFVIPGNDPSLLESNLSQPSVGGTGSYLGLNFSAGGSWQTVAMGNTGDTFHSISPSNIGNDYFSVSWANNTSNPIIYFSGNAGGFNYSMMNTTNDDPFLQANWNKINASGSNETPGLPNNTANANWINLMSNGCKSFVSFSASKNSSDASCPNLCDGKAKVTPLVGSASSYKYLWSSNPIQTTAQAKNLCPGTYHVIVTDASNCKYIDSVQIHSPSALQVSFTQKNPSCNQYSDGSIIANPLNGNYPLSYLWSNGETTKDINSLKSGNYSLSIADANNCPFDSIINLSQPASINLSFFSVPSSCGVADGSASILAKGGTGIFSYLWSNGKTDSKMDSITSGMYQVIVTDKNACRDSLNVPVGSISGMFPDFSYNPIHPDIFNSKVNFKNETLHTSKWEWNFGGLGNSFFENPDFVFPEAGIYSIQLIVENGSCKDSVVKNIMIEDDFLIYVPNAFTPNLDGCNEYFHAVTRGIDPMNFEFEIFDRWGKKVFISNNIDAGWNGEIAGDSGKEMTELYTWILNCKDIHNKTRHYEGRVNLVR